MPVTPQKELGWRMEPPVSEPRAKKVSPAATAAHEPPEDPPGTCSVFHGFFVDPNQDVSVVLPIANSSIFVLPSRIAPAFLRFSAASAEYGGTNPLKILELHVVSIPSVQILSLIAIGTPASGPVRMPSSICFWISSACASAASSVSVT